MNNKQLQEAIDKSMTFVLSKDGGYPQDRYREMASKHLEELLRVQLIRSQIVSFPTVTVGETK